MGKWKRNLSLTKRWQRSYLINKYGNKCYLCEGVIPTMKDITVDHWVPISKGGTDDIENYRLAHSKCNHLKADMTPEQFEQFQRGEISYT